MSATQAEPQVISDDEAEQVARPRAGHQWYSSTACGNRLDAKPAIVGHSFGLLPRARVFSFEVCRLTLRVARRARCWGPLVAQTTANPRQPAAAPMAPARS